MEIMTSAPALRPGETIILDDETYDSIFTKLSDGSPFEWSYPPGVLCPHPADQRSICPCAKYMNVLGHFGDEPRVMRSQDGLKIPVYRESEEPPEIEPQETSPVPSTPMYCITALAHEPCFRSHCMQLCTQPLSSDSTTRKVWCSRCECSHGGHGGQANSLHHSSTWGI